MNPAMTSHSSESTRMFAEAGEAAEAVQRQLAANAGIVDALAARLRARPPDFIVTCARGSSDHAATFAKYLFETRLGLVTASASPSIASVYAVEPRMRGALFIAISQSGRSPDLLRSTELAREAGACVVVLVNKEDSPLAQLADHVIPLRAGAETSVAARLTSACRRKSICRISRTSGIEMNGVERKISACARSSSAICGWR